MGAVACIVLVVKEAFAFARGRGSNGNVREHDQIWQEIRAMRTTLDEVKETLTRIEAQRGQPSRD